MAEINWKSKEEQEKENASPSTEEMSTMAIMELAEIVSAMVTEGGK